MASAFIFILISAFAALPPGPVCYQDWIGLDFGADFRLILVKFAENQAPNCAWFQLLHDSVFKVTAWFDSST